MSGEADLHRNRFLSLFSGTYGGRSHLRMHAELLGTLSVRNRARLTTTCLTGWLIDRRFTHTMVLSLALMPPLIIGEIQSPLMTIHVNLSRGLVLLMTRGSCPHSQTLLLLYYRYWFTLSHSRAELLHFIRHSPESPIPFSGPDLEDLLSLGPAFLGIHVHQTELRLRNQLELIILHAARIYYVSNRAEI